MHLEFCKRIAILIFHGIKERTVFSLSRLPWLFPVWHSEAKPRRILVGFWIKTPLPVDESYNFHPWGKCQYEVRKIISSFVSSLACQWCNTNADFFNRPGQRKSQNPDMLFLNDTLSAGKLLTLTTDQKRILKNNPFKPCNKRRMCFCRPAKDSYKNIEESQIDNMHVWPKLERT